MTSTIALSPASPDGQNGWYRSAVTATVSAPAVNTTVQHTRCQLDPATAPGGFGALPAACPYAGSGGQVAGDGSHTVYAASQDAAGEQETPVNATFKIDRTPPVITCPGMPSFTFGSQGALIGMVSDATSGAQSTTVSASVSTNQLGNHAVTLSAADLAGNTAQKQCAYTVIPPRLNPFASWNLTWQTGAPFTTKFVGAFTIAGVAGGANVKLICSGKGCPFGSKLAPAAAPCPKRQPKCKPKIPTGTHTVQLGPIIDGKVFHAGNSLLLAIFKTGAIGKSYVFKFRKGQGPTVAKGCLLPGSLKPRKTC
jgi:hypothetical protein